MPFSTSPHGTLPLADQSPERPVVLLIEAHEDLRFLFKTALEMLKFKVIEQTESVNVLQTANREHVNLIVIDAGNSRAGCIEAVRAIRRRVSKTDLPVFVLSAYAEARFQEQVRAAGCNEFFIQPFDMGDFGTAITNQIYNTVRPDQIVRQS